MEIASIAIIKLALITFLGFCLYKKNFIKEEALQFLTFFVINITIPFLFFSHLVENSQLVLAHSLGIFIVISISIFLCGSILGVIFSFRKNPGARREFISLVSFQNAGYLPMNLVLFLFSPQVREKFFVYIFLYLLGFNILMWSIGSFFIFKKESETFSFKGIFTPPIMGTVIALLLIYTNTARFIPVLIISPLKMVGEMSFVLSMIILGCWLAKVRLKGFFQRAFLVGEVALLKLIILPLLFLMGVVYFKIFSLLGVFIVLEAAMPSAVSLPIITYFKGADSEFVSQGVFLTHVLSIITIPLWLYWLQLLGFSL